MSEPTEAQLRKLKRLLAAADQYIDALLAQINAPKKSRPKPPAVLEQKPLMVGVEETAWAGYHAHRKALKVKPLTPRGLELMAAEFAKHPTHIQIAAVDQSIRNGWQGIFFNKVQNVPASRVETMKQRLQEWIAKSSQS